MAVLEQQYRALQKGKYPRLVRGHEVGTLKKLLARLDRAKLGHGKYLGYCKTHAAYFIDRRHTNNTIRCPICDAEWLLKHGH
jgi:hypothetical protein